ncbi:hypothetical protein HNP46_000164 [Pseudomonas nitritireducens]|uniref:Uncharacterized protein n=1 Tax=Pseudomonas nitroreducens TaxID=46680 RepID=A0A7W7NY62_PSENT|nr:hypothetical protein [Pseudomonas nitritireducens]
MSSPSDIQSLDYRPLENAVIVYLLARYGIGIEGFLIARCNAFCILQKITERLWKG